MFKSKLLWTGALAGLGLVTAAAYAEPTQQELMQKINDLQAQVTQLQSNQATQQHQLDARDVDATVNSVLNDADSHSMLVDGGGVTAGWDKTKMGFFIASEDGSSLLHPGFVYQFRYDGAWTEGGKGVGTKTANGFENERVKVYADGNLFTKDLTFKIQYTTAKTASTATAESTTGTSETITTVKGGTFVLDDAYAQYVFAHAVVCDGDLGVKLGQFKDPVSKEQTMPDQGSLCVERSLMDDLIGGGLIGPRVQGAGLVLVGNGPLHAQLFFDDGADSVNTDFQQPTFTTVIVPGFTEVVNWGASARVDYKVTGDWSDANRFTAKGDKQDLLVVGFGANATDMTKAMVFIYSADVQFNTMDGKLSLYAAGFGNDINLRGVGAPGNVQNFGLMLQAGYLLTDSLELFARWDVTYLDAEIKSLNNNQNYYNEICTGVNYYLGENGSWGNHAKVSLDLSYLPEGTPASFADGDILKQTNDKAEFIARLQFQLWI